MGEGDGAGRHSTMTVIGYCAATAVTLWTAGYTVGRDKIKDELEQYQRSKDWNLPGLIAELGPLSEKLNLSADERSALMTCEKESAQLEDLKKQNDQISKDLTAARQRITQLEGGNTFEVTSGTIHPIVAGRLVLAVTSVLSSYCSVRLGETTELMEIGESLDASDGDVTYRIILLSMNEGDQLCRFSIDDGGSP